MEKLMMWSKMCITKVINLRTEDTTTTTTTTTTKATEEDLTEVDKETTSDEFRNDTRI